MIISDELLTTEEFPKKITIFGKDIYIFSKFYIVFSHIFLRNISENLLNMHSSNFFTNAFAKFSLK